MYCTNWGRTVSKFQHTFGNNLLYSYGLNVARFQVKFQYENQSMIIDLDGIARSL